MDLFADFEDVMSTVSKPNRDTRKLDLLTTNKPTITQPHDNKKRAGSPMTKNSKQQRLKRTQADMATYLKSLSPQPAESEDDDSSIDETLHPPKQSQREGIDLIRLLRLDEAESHKIASLAQKTKIARGVQESIRDELRTKISPVQVTLENEVTEAERKVELWRTKRDDEQARLKAAEAAVVLARKKVKGSGTKVVASEMKLREKRKMRVLMKRFGDGEELDEGEMEKVLVILEVVSDQRHREIAITLRWKR